MSGLLHPDHIQTLESIASAHPEDIIRKRAKLLLFLNDGKSAQETADEVGFSASTVRRWNRRYRAEAMEIFSGSLDDGISPSSMDAQPENEKKEGEPAEKKKSVTKKKKTKKEGKEKKGKKKGSKAGKKADKKKGSKAGKKIDKKKKSKGKKKKQ